MEQAVDQFEQLPRRFAAHWVAAVIALAGAAAIQVLWPAAIRPEAGQRWWILLIAATAYLLATARFHFRKAQWRPNELVPRLWSLGRWLGCDLLICLLAGMLIWEGHQTSVFQAGLWLIPPILLAVSAASALAGLTALHDGSKRFRKDIPPADAPRTGYRRDILRFVSFAVLTLLLLAFR